MEYRITEYEQALATYRYFLDYRIKIFGFLVTINGVLLTVVLTHAQTPYAKSILSLFAILVLIMGLIAELRSIQISDSYRKAAVELEEVLGFTVMAKLHMSIEERVEAGRFTLRYAFRAMYFLIIIFWIVEIYLVKPWL